MDRNQTSPEYFPGDLINHNKIGRATVVAATGNPGEWTLEWLTGRYAGQKRPQVLDHRTRMIEAVERPAPKPQTKTKAAAPTKPAKEAPAGTSEIVWSDPPSAERTHRRSPVDYAAVADKLRARQGAWAEIKDAADKPTTAAHVANKARHGELAGFGPDGAFEAKNVGHRVWARYVGA